MWTSGQVNLTKDQLLDIASMFTFWRPCSYSSFSTAQMHCNYCQALLRTNHTFDRFNTGRKSDSPRVLFKMVVVLYTHIHLPINPCLPLQMKSPMVRNLRAATVSCSCMALYRFTRAQMKMRKKKKKKNSLTRRDKGGEGKHPIR